MFSHIRWRITVLVVLMIFIGMGGLMLFLTQGSCLEDRDCVGQAVATTAVLMALSAPLLAYLAALPTVRPLQKLIQVTGRITAGEHSARVLPQTRDELGQFIVVYNDMLSNLQEQLQQLSEENEQINTVLGYMADGTIITDDLGYVRLINPAASRLLGSSKAAALGRSYAEVMRHHQLIELWQKCQESGRQQSSAVEIGRSLFLQVVVTPFRERESEGFLVILQDLTQVRHLQTVRRDFISNISHELRTPLASLRAIVETIEDGAIDDKPVAHRFLGRALQEIDVMAQMVEELLELSRIESGQVPLQLAETAVSDLLLIPTSRLREQADRHQIELIVDITPGLPKVLADAERVQRVIANLLHNAVKFTQDGGRIIVSAYKSEKEPHAVVISVKDNGIGIAKEEIGRVFERFYKSDRARTRGQGGTGLGLAISRHIVQAHQGQIWVKSKENKGSTFFFSLPVG